MFEANYGYLHLTKRELAQLGKGDKMEILCGDGHHYHVEVRDIADGIVTLHFLFWSSKHDFRGILSELYIAPLGKYSVGISPQNKYITTVKKEDDPEANANKKPSENGSSSRTALSTTKYSEDFLARPRWVFKRRSSEGDDGTNGENSEGRRSLRSLRPRKHFDDEIFEDTQKLAAKNAPESEIVGASDIPNEEDDFDNDVDDVEVEETREVWLVLHVLLCSACLWLCVFCVSGSLPTQRYEEAQHGPGLVRGGGKDPLWSRGALRDEVDRGGQAAAWTHKQLLSTSLAFAPSTYPAAMGSECGHEHGRCFVRPPRWGGGQARRCSRTGYVEGWGWGWGQEG